MPMRGRLRITSYNVCYTKLLRREAALSSEMGTVQSNPDGSVDVYFGPEPPVGKENNWIQTVPGKGWFTIFRLYSPLEPWFDKTWRPGEIVKMG